MSWVAIISSLIGSGLMFVIGSLKTFYAVNSFFMSNTDGPLNTIDMATSYVIKSLDAFLIAFVLFIFAYGVYKLFIDSNSADTDKTLSWINISSISQLKKILAELIVVIIFVKFLEIVLLNLNNLSWEMMILPISIVLLSLGLKLLELK
ncbi:MAG: YqhA family protein [Piscirickettsiaceae bacterium]|nr:YqhA family protein [Piscirickettsiaceae bacterium]